MAPLVKLVFFILTLDHTAFVVFKHSETHELKRQLARPVGQMGHHLSVNCLARNLEAHLFDDKRCQFGHDVQ